MSSPERAHGQDLRGPLDPETEATSVPVPEYEASQYGMDPRHVSAAHRDVLRREFGLVRTYFKARPGSYWKLQRKLNQGRFGTTYDVYLARAFWYSVGAGLLGLVVGVLVTWLLASSGIIGTLESPLSISGGIVQYISANRVLVVGGAAALIGFGLFGGMAWGAFYYHPFMIVDSRRRNIEVMLPHALVYMYALSFGGMDFIEVLKRMAAADETYGEVAYEIDMLVRDEEIFGNDLFTAIRNARNLTPSDSMEQFLDDLLSTLDSGGNVTTFLRDESEKFMDEAQNEQENFLDTLETLSEVFIVTFVAAPLFFIVTLMMMSFLGAATMAPMFLVVYIVLPLSMAGFGLLIATIAEPYKDPGHEIDLDRRGDIAVPDEITGYRGYHLFRRIRLRAQLREFIDAPLELFKQRPQLTLVLSVPAALLVVAVVILSGTVSLSLDAILSNPYWATVAIAVVPFLIATVPLMIFHELNERHETNVARRLPDTLDILASANQMGIQLSEGLDIVSRNITGAFARELSIVRNDIEWNQDIRGALLGLADRLKVPQLTRTCKIVAEGSRSTGNLHRILSIAAEDTRHRYRMARNRQQTLNSYTVIVIVGFLVYLGVIVVIDNSFLAPMIDRFAGVDPSSATAQTPIGVDPDTLSMYQAVFFHSALIQAVGTGLISGKLTDNQATSGLKYSIGLILISLVVFGLL